MFETEIKNRKSVIEALSLDYNSSMYKKKPIFAFVKRLFDICSSFLGIVLLSWFFILMILIILIVDKQNPFYAHERIGKNGKKFKMLKFQTMNSKEKRPIEEILTPEQLEEYRTEYKITNDPRVTKLGKFLRKTSIDELPQLFNIFAGQISVVGYRAIVSKELEEKYNEEERKLLLKTKPGLTGFWTSHGRSDIPYDERVKMELYYCYKRSLWLDIRIIWHTFIRLFKSGEAKWYYFLNLTLRLNLGQDMN